MDPFKSSHKYYSVRKATRGDVPSIAKMIKGLAEYLGEADQLKIGEKELLRDGFGEKPLFYCLVTEEVRTVMSTDEDAADHRVVRKRGYLQNNKEILGAAIYFFTYSTWEGSMLYLEDLFVIPNARGQGIGTSMMQKLAKIAREHNCARMQWMSPQGRPSVRFYNNIGAECLGDWCVFRLEKKELELLASRVRSYSGQDSGLLENGKESQ